MIENLVIKLNSWLSFSLMVSRAVDKYWFFCRSLLKNFHLAAVQKQVRSVGWSVVVYRVLCVGAGITMNLECRLCTDEICAGKRNFTTDQTKFG